MLRYDSFFGGDLGVYTPPPYFTATLTVPSGKVASDLTDFVVKVELADMPVGFWDDVRSDGGNIRITDSGMTELPLDVVWVDDSLETGVLFFKATLLAASDNEFVITVGDPSQTAVAVTDPTGRNAVWSDYLRSYAATDFVDRTGSGETISAQGSISLSADKFAIFDANAKNMRSASLGILGTTWTMGGTGRVSTTVGGAGLIGLSPLTGATAHVSLGQSGGQLENWDSNNSSLFVSGVSVGPTYRFSCRYQGTTQRDAFLNGVKATDTTITARPTGVNHYIFMGCGNRDGSNTSTFRWKGEASYWYLRMEALSDDWLEAEADNWVGTGFYTVT